MASDIEMRLRRAYVARGQARQCVVAAERRAAPWRYVPGAMAALRAALDEYERADIRVYRLLREREQTRLPTWRELRGDGVF